MVAVSVERGGGRRGGGDGVLVTQGRGDGGSGGHGDGVDAGEHLECGSFVGCWEGFLGLWRRVLRWMGRLKN